MTTRAHFSPNLTIRRAIQSDAGLLTELGARTFSETFAADNSPENMAAYLAEAFSPERQALELADGNATILIADISGTAVGYSILRPGIAPASVTGAEPIELVRLYVDQQHHGQGVGAALMQKCIDEASGHGYQTLWLGVWENNKNAQNFYRKWKFREVGTHVFQLGDDPQTDLRDGT